MAAARERVSGRREKKEEGAVENQGQAPGKIQYSLCVLGRKYIASHVPRKMHVHAIKRG